MIYSSWCDYVTCTSKQVKVSIRKIVVAKETAYSSAGE